MGGGSRFGSASPDSLFKDAGLNQADQDFLNQERNSQLRSETLEKLRTKSGKTIRGFAKAAIGNRILGPGIREAINTARAANYFGDARQSLMSAPELQSMIAQQQASTLQGVPTLGILPMMQGGFGQPQGGFGQPQGGGSLFNSLATQGMNQISQGQTMNPTLLKAKV
tara:strand:+ start:623 stop:1126 length:504 start_codon:yes stop_codon:yes gene_type:complete